MKQRDDMTFANEEYQQRISGLRQRMQERRLDAVVISDPENIMYLTDYQTTGYSFFQALVVPLDAEPVMITRKLEESNTIHRTWVERTRPYPDTGDAIKTLVDVLEEIGPKGARGSHLTDRTCACRKVALDHDHAFDDLIRAISIPDAPAAHGIAFGHAHEADRA